MSSGEDKEKRRMYITICLCMHKETLEEYTEISHILDIFRMAIRHPVKGWEGWWAGGENENFHYIQGLAQITPLLYYKNFYYKIMSM